MGPEVGNKFGEIFLRVTPARYMANAGKGETPNQAR